MFAVLQVNAGTLCDITISIAKVKDAVSVKWETPKRPREVIPGGCLYLPSILAPFSDVNLRFLKCASLAAHLPLTTLEIAHFANDTDSTTNGG
jgi:hypothetical protein